ncbi:hypothetical protein EYF80_009199 [Liparis tanakae]|uniref:Uncharacterized protein n=1 Tax=Liparis tanakae TaxID=230148 RepID=A0A4Z2IR25_9TELE|nr:hypothetical protein EYF80_009199 [Liparis tanakae]
MRYRHTERDETSRRKRRKRSTADGNLQDGLFKVSLSREEPVPPEASLLKSEVSLLVSSPADIRDQGGTPARPAICHLDTWRDGSLTPRDPRAASQCSCQTTSRAAVQTLNRSKAQSPFPFLLQLLLTASRSGPSEPRAVGVHASLSLFHLLGIPSSPPAMPSESKEGNFSLTRSKHGARRKSEENGAGRRRRPGSTRRATAGLTLTKHAVMGMKGGSDEKHPEKGTE